MPSYDFTCRACSAPFVARVSMSAYAAGEGRQCPACGSTDVERQFTAVSVMTSSRSGSSGTGGCGSRSGFT